MDFIRFGHDCELNRTDCGMPCQQGFAHTMTAIHQRAICIQDNWPFKIRRLNPLTVASDFTKGRLPAGTKPAVLIQLPNR
ncbi:hypothetical protein D9M68_966510 [compost metagenome]